MRSACIGIPTAVLVFAAASLTSLTALAADQVPVTMLNTSGDVVGKVMLHETPHGTLLHARFTNLPPGPHAFHVHDVGICEPPFTSAGGHFNPTNVKHGIMNSEGVHAGDMPNIHVPANGALEIEVLNTMLRLDDSLFDADGAAIVIHEGPDDYVTDPAGAAGPRIACGVISRQE